NQWDRKGTGRGKRTAATVGGGAALGAVIGAIAGGGKGAAIGAGAGAAAGTGVQGVTKGQKVELPAETVLDFELAQPVTVTPVATLNRYFHVVSLRGRENSRPALHPNQRMLRISARLHTKNDAQRIGRALDSLLPS